MSFLPAFSLRTNHVLYWPAKSLYYCRSIYPTGDVMSKADTLEEIKDDLNFLKDKIVQIEITVNEIDADVHRVPNPDYLKKLKTIEKEDKRIHFKNIDDFDKHFGL